MNTTAGVMVNGPSNHEPCRQSRMDGYRDKQRDRYKDHQEPTWTNIDTEGYLHSERRTYTITVPITCESTWTLILTAVTALTIETFLTSTSRGILGTFIHI